MKILMLETMTYGDDISLEQFNRLGEVVTYSLSSYEEDEIYYNKNSGKSCRS